MTHVQLRPLDTWFFRDGTPFSADGAPQEDVKGLFPPHPATVAGALRAWLALNNGWGGRGRWSPEVGDVLGDGPTDLGQLSLEGPFLLRDGQPLFRAPRHLLGTASDSGDWKPKVLLRPGEPVQCDLGERVRLPAFPEAESDWADIKVSEDVWIAPDGMRAVLQGQLPAHETVVCSQRLWSEEPRIGLKRDVRTRTAEESMLYSTRHVRLAHGVSLGVRVAGLPARWKTPSGSLIPLGGESRLAECDKWSGNLSLAGAEVGRCLALVALSPLDLEQDIYRGRRALRLPGLGDAYVVSACLGRPQRIGGWDSLARGPLPMQSVLSPGSVLFCELLKAPTTSDAMADDGVMRIGARREWGFGLVVIGRWPDQ